MAFPDDFNRSDETLETDAGWTLQDGTAGSLKIVSNELKTNNKAALFSYICTDQGSADCYVQAKRLFWGTPSFLEEIVLRVVDKDNWIGHKYNGIGAAGRRLTKNVAGTQTDLITSQGVSQEWVKVEASGNSIELFEGGTGATPSWTQVGSTQTVTDHNTETSIGFAGYSWGTSAYWDDFEAGALAGGPTTYFQTMTPAAVGTSILITAAILSVINTYVAAGTNSISKFIKKTLGLSGIGNSEITKKTSKTITYNATGTSTLQEALILIQSAAMAAIGTLVTATLFIAFVATNAALFVKRIAIKLGIGL